MSFGRKGLAPGQSAPVMAEPGNASGARTASFSAYSGETETGGGGDDMAAKRAAFVASEKARKKSEVGEVLLGGPRRKPEEHDALINLRNMPRSEPRAAKPLTEDGNGAGGEAGGPIGASGLSAAQEAQIRETARGMAQNKPAKYGERAGGAAGGSSGGSGGSGGSGYIFGDPHSRNVGLAYVLWFVLGQLSMHRFYCGQKDTAIIQLSLWIGSLVTLFIFPPIGIVGLLIWTCWLFGDLFMIPGMLRKFQAEHDYRGIFA